MAICFHLIVRNGLAHKSVQGQSCHVFGLRPNTSGVYSAQNESGLYSSMSYYPSSHVCECKIRLVLKAE